MADVMPDTRPGPDAPQAPETEERLSVVGTSPAHHDFVDKVKGSLLYAADWKLPGMLYGKIVRSDLASARIVDIDTTAARSLSGVVAVLTADDVPSNKIVENASGGLGEVSVAQPVLADGQVRYVGEPVAVIAATEPEIADQAVDLVEVTYEELPGVFDVETALAPDAPSVHAVGNTLVNWHIDKGDVDTAMAEADVVVEGEYRSQHVEHAYLETEAGVGWLENDVLTLRVSTQVIEHASEVAQILNVPQNKVRVIAAYMGGGFGGKEDMTVEPYIALLTWHTRRPVRMVWSRQESMLASTKRHPFLMRYRTGAKSDGTVVAQETEIIGDAGAYPCLSARVLFAGAALSAGPYRVPNVRTRSRAVFTNNVPTSAFRGFGAMQVVFGYESQMDRLARRLGLSRQEVRDRNFVEKGDLLPSGEPITTAVAVAETRDLALKELGEPAPPSGPGKQVGQGFGCSMQPYGRTIWFRDHASAWLTLQADGSLLIRSGVTDLGAGQAASLCQIASEILGVPLDDISVYIGDTALNPPAGGTFATRQLFMSGNAILRAARELRDQLAPVAAELLDVPVDRLSWEDGLVKTRSDDPSGQWGRTRHQPRRARPRLPGARRLHVQPVHLAGTGREVRPGQGPGRHLPRLHVRHARGRGGGRRRDRRRRRPQVRREPRRRPADQPDARRGPDPGRSHAGTGIRADGGLRERGGQPGLDPFRELPDPEHHGHARRADGRRRERRRTRAAQRARDRGTAGWADGRHDRQRDRGCDRRTPGQAAHDPRASSRPP